MTNKWKGDKAGYGAKHCWVRKHFYKPSVCEHCGRNDKFVYRIEWANISGKHKRERNDWLALCPSCHRKFDRKVECRNGHLYTKENTYINSDGNRECKICMAATRKRYRNKVRRKENEIN